MKHEYNATCPLCGNAKRKHQTKSQSDIRRTAARSLASHLCFVFQIPPRKDLVLILGHGNEANNQQAIASWIQDRLCHIEQWPLPSGEVNDLIDCLERDLGNILSDLNHGAMHVQ